MVGIVNLSVDTLAIPSIHAIIITTYYMWILNRVFVWINRADIRLKI